MHKAPRLCLSRRVRAAEVFPQWQFPRSRPAQPIKRQRPWCRGVEWLSLPQSRQTRRVRRGGDHVVCLLAGVALLAGALAVRIFGFLRCGGDAAPHGKPEIRHEDGGHGDGAREGSFGLQAVAVYAGVVGRGAGLGDVPGSAVLGVGRVASVAADLVGDGDGVDGKEDGVYQDAEDGREDMAEVHYAFCEHDEHAEDGDDDVVVGYTGLGVSVGAVWLLEEDLQLGPDFGGGVWSVVRCCV